MNESCWSESVAGSRQGINRRGLKASKGDAKLSAIWGAFIESMNELTPAFFAVSKRWINKICGIHVPVRNVCEREICAGKPWRRRVETIDAPRIGAVGIQIVQIHRVGSEAVRRRSACYGKDSA